MHSIPTTTPASSSSIPTSNTGRKRRPTISATDYRDEFIGGVNRTTTQLSEYLKTVDDKEKSNPLFLALSSCVQLLSFTMEHFLPKECLIEKERRERSIVVEFLPESTKSLASQRVDEDYDHVRNMLDAADIEVRPETVFRMGTKNPSSGRPPLPRLLKVVLPRASSQKALLMRAKKLAEIPEFKNLRIRPSLSSAEREQQFQLRQEKRKRNDAGGKWVIFAGKLMEKAKVGDYIAANKGGRSAVNTPFMAGPSFSFAAIAPF
ncbi:hypothetical protein DXG03_002563 [Asterophora parasitica]|uniref:Uncharacterized protein n=1 Tax=Asterophora parasitica TaxID=117018 RepID=A0A9P7G303_9AGAR|nr:hypothetical protein DXG03_002563 [Asterophora parasitica]